MEGDLTMSNEFSTSMFGQRMIDYYPPVIAGIKEFRSIISAEYPEIENLHAAKDNVLNNAYLSTMDENRIAAWEKALKIVPLANSTIEDRRDVIIARMRGQGKLNTEVINTIVNSFTGGTAKSWIENSTLYVEITPPPDNKQYRFENVENELKNKVPAHLGLVVIRNYYTWGELKNNNETWQDVSDNFAKWEDALLYTESTYKGVSK